MSPLKTVASPSATIAPTAMATSATAPAARLQTRCSSTMSATPIRG